MKRILPLILIIMSRKRDIGGVILHFALTLILFVAAILTGRHRKKDGEKENF